MSDFGYKVRLATVRKRTSANGNEYFAGFMGDANVVMFRDVEGDNEWGPAWAIYVQERPKKRQTRAQGQRKKPSCSSAKPAAKSTTERARDGSGEKAKASGDASAGQPFDDEVPF